MMIKKNTSFEEIYAIMVECGDSFYDQSYNQEPLIKKIADKFHRYANFVSVCIDETIAGFIAYYNNNQETKSAFISMIVVKKEFAGKGLGTLLLKYACDDSAEKGMRNIGLEVDYRNINAIGFYQKNNFYKKEYKSETSLLFERMLK